MRAASCHVSCSSVVLVGHCLFGDGNATVRQRDRSEWRVGGLMLRYCRNVHPTWVKFDSKDTKESGSVFEVLSTKSKKRT